MAKLDPEAMAKVFQHQATTYEFRTGGATKTVSKYIMQYLPPLDGGSIILDNACGAGAVTADLLTQCPTARIEAVDVSPAMIDIVNTRIADNSSWKGRVTAKVCDGQDLSLDSDRYDLSIMNFGIFFFPDPDAGAREIVRTLKPGGMACVTCWKASALRDIFNAVQAVVKPATEVESSPVFEKWTKPETLPGTLTRAGLKNVRLHEKPVVMAWDDEETLVKAMTLNMGALSGDSWTQDEKARIPTALKIVLAESPELFDVPGGIPEKGVAQTAFVAFGEK
ncbi:MAG: hypothetical protein M1828_000485 [Chrysothrix sp. TS-e1954]|nr:MAG: hypothetical protein M1828_000485 [Chrysothrix sp. TS-e1954]